MQAPDLKIFGEEATFHHIGVAVQSIKQALKEETPIIVDRTQRVSVAFVRFNGITIEFIQPLEKNTPITNNLLKGQRLVHVCFQVPHLEKAILRGRKHGFHCIAKPVEAVAFDNRRITWLFSKIYGLVELLETG